MNDPSIELPSGSNAQTSAAFEAVPCMMRGQDGQTQVYGLLIRPAVTISQTSSGRSKTKTILPKLAPQPLSVATQQAEVDYDHHYDQSSTSYRHYEQASTSYDEVLQNEEFTAAPRPQLAWQPSHQDVNSANGVQPAPHTGGGGGGTPDSGVHSVTGSPMTPMISPRARESPPDFPSRSQPTHQHRNNHVDSYDDMPRLQPLDAETVTPRPTSSCTSVDGSASSNENATKGKIVVLSEDDPSGLAEVLKSTLNKEQLKQLQHFLRKPRERNGTKKRSESRQLDSIRSVSPTTKRRMAERLAEHRRRAERLLKGLSLEPINETDVDCLCQLMSRVTIDAQVQTQHNGDLMSQWKATLSHALEHPAPALEALVPKMRRNGVKRVRLSDTVTIITDVVSPREEKKRKVPRFPTAPCSNFVQQGMSRRRTDLKEAVELTAEEDFTLPYDIWFESIAATIDPSSTYRKIRANIYIDPLPSTPSTSNCTCISNCDDTCINRGTFVECTSENCRAEHCTNRRLQQLTESNCFDAIERFDTQSLRGRGIRAIRPIKAGTLIGEYVGEVISTQRLEHRLHTCYSTFKHHYAVTIAPRTVIDAYCCGNLTRYINHSCRPNCVMEKWDVNGKPRAAIVSLYDIGAGEELTYDYAFLSNDRGKRQPCLCAAENCRRFITAAQSPSSSNGSTLTLRQKAFIRAKMIFLLRCRLKEPRVHNCIRRCKDKQLKEEKSPSKSPNSRQQRTAHGDVIISSTVDLSYVTEADERCPVGSYDTDDGYTRLPEQASGDDQVRCVCGMMDDEGDMAQCDVCKYWLHVECSTPPDDAQYMCYYCQVESESQRRPPLRDITLSEPPEVRFDAVTYYRALVTPNRRMQVRLDECVYVVSMSEDELRPLLSRLNDMCQNAKKYTRKQENDNCNVNKQYNRTELRVMRVDRLLEAPDGSRYVFGNYYARPHETFCEPTRRFCKNELIQTPLYGTLPLSAVVARCLVVDSAVYCKGRPVAPRYHDDDVFVCDWKVDKAQRIFEKIGSKSKREQCNTEPYAFEHYTERMILKRDFTPFVMSTETAPSKSNKLARQRRIARLNRIITRLEHRNHSE